MFVTGGVPLAIVRCTVAMMGWESWANTQELAGKEKWPFPCRCWGCAAGVYGGQFRPGVDAKGENMHQAALGFVLAAATGGLATALTKWRFRKDDL